LGFNYILKVNNFNFSKSKLGVVYHFWDFLINENDELFLHFFIVAFLKFHKERIVSSDHSQIPTLLSQLCLKAKDEVTMIFSLAKDIRLKTPYSLRIMARNLEVFTPYSNKLKDLFNFYKPETLFLFPLLPCEILSVAYNNMILCPDIRCKNYKNIFDGEGSIFCDENFKENKYSYKGNLKKF
jgi:hypothetical protein